MHFGMTLSVPGIQFRVYIVFDSSGHVSDCVSICIVIFQCKYNNNQRYTLKESTNNPFLSTNGKSPEFFHGCLVIRCPNIDGIFCSSNHLASPVRASVSLSSQCLTEFLPIISVTYFTERNGIFNSLHTYACAYASISTMSPWKEAASVINVSPVLQIPDLS